MPIPRTRVAALAAAGALLFGLSACTPESAPEPVPSASEAPIFASDEEALAAAVEAYEAYAAISDAIVHDGGAEPDRITHVVSPEYLATVKEEFAAFRKLGLRTTGTTQQEQAELVSRSESSGAASVAIYLCQDPSEVRVLDADGMDVTPADRPALIPSQAFLVSSGDDPTVLLIDGVEKWRGQDFC